jgi:uncharacterized protein (TIGR03435 family)
MFQTLLEDRFQLKVHRQKRELAAYDLVVTKGGPKLVMAPSRSVKPSMGFGGSSSGAEFREDGKHLVGKGASMEEMVVVLTTQMRARCGTAPALRDLTISMWHSQPGSTGSTSPFLGPPFTTSA